MDPNDPRHGSDAGAVAHRRAGEKPCAACLEGHRRANIRRQLYPSKVPSVGTRRRIQALQAIGYSRAFIAREMGYKDYGALTYMTREDTQTILKVTADRVADVYKRFHMVIPEGAAAKRARTWAAKHGYAKPLQWDDIDDPDETPAGGYVPSGRQRNAGGAFAESECEPFDEATVVRILGGEWRLPCTPADRAEVVRRWTGKDHMASYRGRRDEDYDEPNYAYLARLTGWKVERYRPRKDDAA